MGSIWNSFVWYGMYMLCLVCGIVLYGRECLWNVYVMFSIYYSFVWCGMFMECIWSFD